MEGHDQHTERIAIENLAVGLPGLKRVMICASSSDNEFADPAGRIGSSGGVLGREPLIIVVVADEDDIGAGLVQALPERFIRPITPVRPWRGTRMMAAGKGDS